ncbi:MAG: sigma 54-dependent Fis family transcriptional regulator [Myxococcales bacterium]|nr:sigma 54-dependent Fis family transcriptional regulator [Myxococcales bacterium]
MGGPETRATTSLADPELSIRRDLSRLRLLVAEGPDAGKWCAIEETPCVLGSDPACDLPLCDDTVSRRHLEARREADGVRIVDLGSRNGTFLEGARIRDVVVGLGASLRLGRTRIKVAPWEENLRREPSGSDRFGAVVGASRRMREIFATLEEVAATDLTLLLQGETGTGKEALAEAVHQRSKRGGGPFVVVDCTTLPRELVESELFGHRKGAFTGAFSDRAGCLEQARGGTLLLDEVGDLPLDSQPKLLRVLEKRQMRPVGSDHAVDIDVRVIAASRDDLRARVEDGRFREDLYYRLAVVTLQLPPLRERPEDVPRLLSHFVSALSGGQRALEFSLAETQELLSLPWEGNVRELRNAVERALALEKGRALDARGFVREMLRTLDGKGARERISFKRAKARVVESFERAYLVELVQRHGGNLSRAAREAGLDRHHLRDLLSKHKIEIP